eukprot:SAG31_NODE_87_length_26728_cov_40.161591_4_plen_214_part_00
MALGLATGRLPLCSRHELVLWKFAAEIVTRWTVIGRLILMYKDGKRTIPLLAAVIILVTFLLIAWVVGVQFMVSAFCLYFPMRKSWSLLIILHQQEQASSSTQKLLSVLLLYWLIFASFAVVGPSDNPPTAAAEVTYFAVGLCWWWMPWWLFEFLRFVVLVWAWHCDGTKVGLKAHPSRRPQVRPNLLLDIMWCRRCSAEYSAALCMLEGKLR